MALDPITGGFDFGRSLLSFGEAVINRIWPDPTVKEETKIKLQQMLQDGELQRLAAQTGLLQGQIDINKIEAQSPTPFVNGWRPAIGWTCSAALFYQYVGSPIIVWVATISGHPIPSPPTLDSMLYELLFAMLGVASLRTVEKIKGVAS